MQDVNRTFPRAMIISCFAVAAIYLIPLCVAMVNTPGNWDDWVDGYIAEVAGYILGNGVKTWTVIAIIAGQFGLLINGAAATTMVIEGMVKYGILPHKMFPFPTDATYLRALAAGATARAALAAAAAAAAAAAEGKALPTTEAELLKFDPEIAAAAAGRSVAVNTSLTVAGDGAGGAGGVGTSLVGVSLTSQMDGHAGLGDGARGHGIISIGDTAAFVENSTVRMMLNEYGYESVHSRQQGGDGGDGDGAGGKMGAVSVGGTYTDHIDGSPGRHRTDVDGSVNSDFHNDHSYSVGGTYTNGAAFGYENDDDWQVSARAAAPSIFMTAEQNNAHVDAGAGADAAASTSTNVNGHNDDDDDDMDGVATNANVSRVFSRAFGCLDVVSTPTALDPEVDAVEEAAAEAAAAAAAAAEAKGTDADRNGKNADEDNGGASASPSDTKLPLSPSVASVDTNDVNNGKINADDANLQSNRVGGDSASPADGSGHELDSYGYYLNQAALNGSAMMQHTPDSKAPSAGAFESAGANLTENDDAGDDIVASDAVWRVGNEIAGELQGDATQGDNGGEEEAVVPLTLQVPLTMGTPLAGPGAGGATKLTQNNSDHVDGTSGAAAREDVAAQPDEATTLQRASSRRNSNPNADNANANAGANANAHGKGGKKHHKQHHKHGNNKPLPPPATPPAPADPAAAAAVGTSTAMTAVTTARGDTAINIDPPLVLTDDHEAAVVAASLPPRPDRSRGTRASAWALCFVTLPLAILFSSPIMSNAFAVVVEIAAIVGAFAVTLQLWATVKHRIVGRRARAVRKARVRARARAAARNAGRAAAAVAALRAAAASAGWTMTVATAREAARAQHLRSKELGQEVDARVAVAAARKYVLQHANVINAGRAKTASAASEQQLQKQFVSSANVAAAVSASSSSTAGVARRLSHESAAAAAAAAGGGATAAAQPASVVTLPTADGGVKVVSSRRNSTESAQPGRLVSGSHGVSNVVGPHSRRNSMEAAGLAPAAPPTLAIIPPQHQQNSALGNAVVAHATGAHGGVSTTLPAPAPLTAGTGTNMSSSLSSTTGAGAGTGGATAGAAGGVAPAMAAHGHSGSSSLNVDSRAAIAAGTDPAHRPRASTYAGVGELPVLHPSAAQASAAAAAGAAAIAAAPAAAAAHSVSATTQSRAVAPVVTGAGTGTAGPGQTQAVVVGHGHSHSVTLPPPPPTTVVRINPVAGALRGVGVFARQQQLLYPTARPVDEDEEDDEDDEDDDEDEDEDEDDYDEDEEGEDEEDEEVGITSVAQGPAGATAGTSAGSVVAVGGGTTRRPMPTSLSTVTENGSLADSASPTSLGASLIAGIDAGSSDVTGAGPGVAKTDPSAEAAAAGAEGEGPSVHSLTLITADNTATNSNSGNAAVPYAANSADAAANPNTSTAAGVTAGAAAAAAGTGAAAVGAGAARARSPRGGSVGAGSPLSHSIAHSHSYGFDYDGYDYYSHGGATPAATAVIDTIMRSGSNVNSTTGAGNVIKITPANNNYNYSEGDMSPARPVQTSSAAVASALAAVSNNNNNAGTDGGAAAGKHLLLHPAPQSQQSLQSQLPPRPPSSRTGAAPVRPIITPTVTTPHGVAAAHHHGPHPAPHGAVATHPHANSVSAAPGVSAAAGANTARAENRLHPSASVGVMMNAMHSPSFNTAPGDGEFSDTESNFGYGRGRGSLAHSQRSYSQNGRMTPVPLVTSEDIEFAVAAAVAQATTPVAPSSGVGLSQRSRLSHSHSDAGAVVAVGGGSPLPPSVAGSQSVARRSQGAARTPRTPLQQRALAAAAEAQARSLSVGRRQQQMHVRTPFAGKDAQDQPQEVLIPGLNQPLPLVVPSAADDSTSLVPAADADAKATSTALVVAGADSNLGHATMETALVADAQIDDANTKIVTTSSDAATNAPAAAASDSAASSSSDAGGVYILPGGLPLLLMCAIIPTILVVFLIVTTSTASIIGSLACVGVSLIMGCIKEYQRRRVHKLRREKAKARARIRAKTAGAGRAGARAGAGAGAGTGVGAGAGVRHSRVGGGRARAGTEANAGNVNKRSHTHQSQGSMPGQAQGQKTRTGRGRRNSVGSAPRNPANSKTKAAQLLANNNKTSTSTGAAAGVEMVPMGSPHSHN